MIYQRDIWQRVIGFARVTVSMRTNSLISKKWSEYCIRTRDQIGLELSQTSAQETGCVRWINVFAACRNSLLSLGRSSLVLNARPLTGAISTPDATGRWWSQGMETLKQEAYMYSIMLSSTLMTRKRWRSSKVSSSSNNKNVGWWPRRRIYTHHEAWKPPSARRVVAVLC